jgi:hypothetical protein
MLAIPAKSKIIAPKAKNPQFSRSANIGATNPLPANGVHLYAIRAFLEKVKV